MKPVKASSNQQLAFLGVMSCFHLHGDGLVTKLLNPSSDLRRIIVGQQKITAKIAQGRK